MDQYYAGSCEEQIDQDRHNQIVQQRLRLEGNTMTVCHLGYGCDTCYTCPRYCDDCDGCPDGLKEGD